jgi:hypothetical protein
MSEENNKLPDQNLFQGDELNGNMVDQYLKLLELGATSDPKETTHFKLLSNILAVSDDNAVYPNKAKIAVQLTVEHAPAFQSATPEQLKKGAELLVAGLNSIYKAIYDICDRDVADKIFMTLRGL